MASYIPPNHPNNERFNVTDFENNYLDYSAYDLRYLKLFGINNVLSINNFYGINQFFNNINSFMYATIFKSLTVANSILSPLFITDKIQTNSIDLKFINGIPYNPVGVLLNLNSIQYPIIKSISSTLTTLGTKNFYNLNPSVILYPGYEIMFYGELNLLLSKITNTTDNIFFSNITLKYNLDCVKIIISFNNKKII